MANIILKDIAGTDVVYNDVKTITTASSPSGTAMFAEGFPSGGSKGQLLIKNSDTSYDTKWESIENIEQIKVPVGMIWWCSWDATTDPSSVHSLVCNGQAVSRTTYAKLFAKIGTKYGSGDGSTTFNVPDLFTDNDGGNNGQFIRAGYGSSIGAKQSDKIRNITGRVGADMQTQYNLNAGTFTLLSDKRKSWADQSSGSYYCNASFSANTDNNSYGNPMAGHADGSDIHPYNIQMLPLIGY